MRPMSLLESGESSGGVSLRSLLDGGPVAIARSGLTLGGVAFLTCRGGWPKAVGPRRLASPGSLPCSRPRTTWTPSLSLTSRGWTA